MRLHDLNLETDLTRHDPNNPTYPPPSGDPENGMEYDGTNHGVSDTWDAKQFTSSYEQVADDALDFVWLSPWPAVLFLADLAIHGLAFVMAMTVDILGAVEINDVSLSHSVLDSVTNSEIDEAMSDLFTLSPINLWTAASFISMKAAQFFATFQLLPHSELLFTLAVGSYIVTSMMLIWVTAQEYLHGTINYLHAFIGLAVLVTGIFFAGHEVSRTSFFFRSVSFLQKYAAPISPDLMNFHDILFVGARLFVLLFGLAVTAAVFWRGNS
ncbi:MAG: hypothetical protein EAX95_02055 [Candidatus Thorarchaeota archaeon]|nr:hypothetical protein [Candidatus Thorarchaeota archaeon]